MTGMIIHGEGTGGQIGQVGMVQAYCIGRPWCPLGRVRVGGGGGGRCRQ